MNINRCYNKIQVITGDSSEQILQGSFHRNANLHFLDHPAELVADRGRELTADSFERLHGGITSTETVHHQVQHVGKLVVEFDQANGLLPLDIKTWQEKADHTTNDCRDDVWLDQIGDKCHTERGNKDQGEIFSDLKL